MEDHKKLRQMFQLTSFYLSKSKHDNHEIHHEFSETPADDSLWVKFPQLSPFAPTPIVEEKVVAVVAFIGRMPYPKP